MAGSDLEDPDEVGEEEEDGSGWSDPSLSVTDGSGHFIKSLKFIVNGQDDDGDDGEDEQDEEDEGFQSSELEEELFLVDSEEEYQEEEEMTTTLFPPDRLCVESLGRAQLCDGLADCAGGEDEAGCEFGQCQPGEFSCLSGRCIPSHWTCDGRPDCQTGEDEVRISLVQRLVVVSHCHSVTVSQCYIVTVSQCHSLTFVFTVRVDVAVRLSRTGPQSGALGQITDVDDGLHTAGPRLAEVTDIVDVVPGVRDHPEVHLARIYRS